MVCGVRRVKMASWLVTAVLLLTASESVVWAHPLVDQVKKLAWEHRVDEAQRLIASTRGSFRGSVQEWLAAVSWVSRGASFVDRWDLAERYAKEALEGSEALLNTRRLDEDPYLPTALGAAIEVLGKYYAQTDLRHAISFFEQQRERYLGTSIEGRIQKNYLLLSFKDKPFPGLHVTKSLIGRTLDPVALEGKVVLYYFWAHWCSDCRRQKPILERLHAEYTGRGLAIVGPTRLYGYVAGGRTATPHEELRYLESSYSQRNQIAKWMAVPVSTENFLNFGISSTPTLVLVDRDKKVQLYHPGGMSYADLSSAIVPLLDAGL